MEEGKRKAPSKLEQMKGKKRKTLNAGKLSDDEEKEAVDCSAAEKDEEVVAEAPEMLTVRYLPKWKSLDKRELPTWYDEAKFGIFIHWGVYSVPAYAPMPEVKAGKTGVTGGSISSGCAEWYWRRLNNPGRYGRQTRDHHQGKYGKEFKYQEFAPMFTAEKWDPNAWADLFVQAGAQYVVLTTKHHEGFCNWGSKASPGWNSVEVGPKRDIVGELTEAVRAKGLRMGFYFSLVEWFNPLYLQDKRKPYGTQFVDHILITQLKELVTTYKPDIIWSDGDWDCPASHWKSKQFLAWLYNESPVKDFVVVNDRWGKGCAGNHGGFWNCQDRFEPTQVMEHKWESCLTMAKSWGYNTQQKPGHYKSVAQLLEWMVRTVAFNGNLLLNIGPKADGTICDLDEERLVGIGQWLAVNGEAIYKTRPYSVQKEASSKVFYACKGSVVYAISFEWPVSGVLRLSGIQEEEGVDLGVTLLGAEEQKNLAWRFVGKSLAITLPTTVPHKHAWVFKLEGLRPLTEEEEAK